MSDSRLISKYKQIKNRRQKRIVVEYNRKNSDLGLWQNMPEYESEDLMPFKTLLVHIKDRDSLNKLAELLNQKILTTTKYIYYPEKPREKLIDLAFVDEDKQ
jgi:hypothetical protein